MDKTNSRNYTFSRLERWNCDHSPRWRKCYWGYATYLTGGAVSNDQWLVTPQITNVQAGDQLSFWMWFPFSSFADSVDVLISTTGTAPADFNVIVDQFVLLVGSTDTSWAQYTYQLTNFVTKGSNIYIAWREHVADNIIDGAISLFGFS